jgi:hypothetical protein
MNSMSSEEPPDIRDTNMVGVQIFRSTPVFVNSVLHNFYLLPNIIRMIKSKRMKWAGHATRMGEIRNAYRGLVEKPNETDN